MYADIVVVYSDMFSLEIAGRCTKSYQAVGSVPSPGPTVSRKANL